MGKLPGKSSHKTLVPCPLPPVPSHYLSCCLNPAQGMHAPVSAHSLSVSSTCPPDCPSFPSATTSAFPLPPTTIISYPSVSGPVLAWSMEHMGTGLVLQPQKLPAPYLHLMSQEKSFVFFFLNVKQGKTLSWIWVNMVTWKHSVLTLHWHPRCLTFPVSDIALLGK